MCASTFCIYYYYLAFSIFSVYKYVRIGHGFIQYIIIIEMRVHLPHPIMSVCLSAIHLVTAVYYNN